jgi:very-short-patch-repair endonuclease
MLTVVDDPQSLEFNLTTTSQSATSDTLVSVGGNLPYSYLVPTGKLLDVFLALSTSGRNLKGAARAKARKKTSAWLYNRTRPGFVFLVKEGVFHVAYAGQPGGAGSQHHWHIFCNEAYKAQVEFIVGIAPTPPNPASPQAATGGNYTKEWGGLYLRSEAEIRIAEALEQTGLLYFANARGRVGLKDTVVSDSQLTGRVETDFIVFYQGVCLILEVDGQHHNAQDQAVRDYARDRVLLRAGLPTVRFTAQDCLKRPQQVVAEFVSILQEQRRPEATTPDVQAV